jgi:hypothetical protein
VACMCTPAIQEEGWGGEQCAHLEKQEAASQAVISTMHARRWWADTRQQQQLQKVSPEV